MRRFQCCRLAAIAGAFGLGALLVLLCSFRLALIFATVLLVCLGWQLLRWW
ncbi:MAG TPA: hypothetical protein VN626_05275 [Clostridia bacterium]|nr:hypothetical protein [Clostridia bacterium]